MIPSARAVSPNQPARPRARRRLGAEVGREAALEPARPASSSARVATSAGKGTTYPRLRYLWPAQPEHIA